MPISYIETASLDTALNAPTATALSTASGSAPSYSARAWVNFNGTGTVAIRASGNVSSITDNGTGDYTVNFTTAMADANYAVVANGGSASTNTTVSIGNSPTTLACRVFTVSNGSIADNLVVNVAIFR
jgi:hypothetical protein